MEKYILQNQIIIMRALLELTTDEKIAEQLREAITYSVNALKIY